jgi:acyl-CoA reductase-like NAD-dependent aldehyde dehydrogenase
MNNERRKKLRAIADKLEELKADLAELASEETDYYDNMPEGIQSGEKGDRASEVASSLGEAADAIDEVIGQIEEASE